MNFIYILIGLIILVIGFIWALYNGLVKLKMKVDEAWSGIDVQLKRRSSLIPNLIETVKGYAKHERTVFENVTKARTALIEAKNPGEAAQADNMLAGALKTLFAVAENYPELRASENFRKLQEDLEDTENKIAYSRQFYNANVLNYNTKIKVFPNVLIAQNLGFKPYEFFEAQDARKDVKVGF